MREERQGRRRERWLDECVEVVISPECLHHQLLLRVCMTWHLLSVCMWWYHRAAHTRAAKPQRVRGLVAIAQRWGAGVETQKNVRGEIGGWGRVPFNEPYAPSLSTIYDGA